MKIPETNPYLEFIQAHFPGVYQVNWHHNVQSWYLNEWVHGRIPNQIIEAPPQYGKSVPGAEMIPGYIFKQYPTAKIAYTTYGYELSKDKSAKAKKVMRSERYKLENNDLTVPMSQRGLYQWENSLGGIYLATGRGGPIDGKGFDFLICDDLFKNDEEAMSPTIRESTWKWFTKVAIPRLSPNGRILLFFKRWHNDDVIGRAVRLMELHPDTARYYERMTFPSLMTKEALKVKHPLDPRGIGESLWPYKHTPQQLMSVRLEMGEADFNAVYQQIPINAEGGIIKPKWFKKINKADLPSDLKKVAFCRLGELAKNTIDKNNCYCGLAKDNNNTKYIIDMEYFSEDWPTCLSKIRSIDNPTGVTRVGGHKKSDLYRQVMQCRTKTNKLKGYPAPDPIAFTPDAEAGKLLIVENEQTTNFLEACRNYTGSGRDKREADIQALAGACKMNHSRRSIVQIMAAKRKPKNAKLIQR